MTKRLFNVNCNIWIKLTPYGLQKLEEEERAFAKRHDMVPRPFEPPKVDANGWSQFQLWDFMQRLGPAFIMGGANPIDLGIVIETDDFSQPRDGEELPQ